MILLIGNGIFSDDVSDNVKAALWRLPHNVPSTICGSRRYIQLKNVLDTADF